MRRGLAVFDRLGRAPVLRGAVSLVQLVALLVTSLVLPATQAAAQSDPWALTPGLTARAVFSCDDLTLNNASTADSAPDAGQGHVGTTGRIALNSASNVLGNATPGPGKAVVRTGGSAVSGSTAPASVAVPCAPVSLSGLASTLPGSNANATIPRTTQNRDPLSGPSRTVFSMTSGDSLQLAAGTYYFTRFTLAGAAKVSVAGPVRIFVAGEIQLGGGSWLNQNGNPANVRLFGNGPRLELTASSELNAFVYVPAAQVDLTNQSRIVGGLWARRATLNASRVTKRTALSAPTLTITEPAEGATLPNLASVAVSGVAQDADGPVTLTLNGQTVSVGANGAFTATLDLSSTQPPAITAVAADGDGFTTVVVRALGNCRQPSVRLVSPLPGALLGSRTVPVAVEADSATTVTVNGVAATLEAGVFRIAALDLMGDGVRTLQLNASNVCGSGSATETVDVDTQVPIVALDTPVNGLVVATPTLSVGGTVSDAHLDTVTVNGISAAITAGRFRADLALQPGPNTLTAVARDRLGRPTTSNTVTVTYAPSSADFTLRTELRGQAVFSCEELKVSGNAGTGALASAGPVAVAGDVVSGQGVSVEGNATVDGNASAGPGASVRVLGSARVLGQRRVLPSAPACQPVDLAPIAASLAQTNDNGTIGLTSQGRSPLGGPGGTEFTLQPGESITLSPGAYYFTRFTVSPGASLSISGLVKILCAGEVDWRGSLNATGSPYDLRVFSTGAVMSMQGTAMARAFVYAPAANATLTGGELLGSLFARRVEIRGGARVVRRMDLAPPQLTLTAPLPGAVVGDLHQAVVAGTVTDADSPVVVRVNGLPATVSNGTFTRTLDMSGVLPPFALVIAEDAAGQTAQLQATVCDGPPQVVLVSPAPGTVVGQRIVSVGGTCGTADTVLVNGVPATVVNGTFTLASLDLGGEGDRPLVIAASGPCGPRTSNLLVNVDTLPPDVAIDRPAAGAWLAATPITVEGIVADPHLQSVRVGAVVASVAAGRFRAEGVVLAEGTTSLTAVATDVVGNQSTSAPVTVNLDSSAPVLTITAPSAGAVVSQVPVTVRGTSDDPLLEVRVGMATGTVDNTKQPPEWTVPGVALSEGDNTLTVDGRNLAGTPGTPPSLLLALDTQPPVVSLSSTGVPPFTALDRVTVSGSVFDAHLTSVTVNGVLATVTGGTFTAQNVPLAEGPNQIVATALDAGGLSGTSGALNVTRDSVVPVIVLDALAQSLTNQRQLTVNGTITEANLTAITVNGAPATVTGNRFTATVPLTEGANAVRAHAEDLAGNVADSNTLSPELDTIPPAVAFSGLGLAANACAAGGAPLTVSGTYGDVHPATSNAIAIELRPAGGGAPTSVPVTLDASGRAFAAPGVVLGTVDGTAILIATATDGAGNVAKAVFSQRVDATTPTVRIVLDGATFPGSASGEVPGVTPTLLNRTLLPRAEVDDGSEAAPPVAVMTLDGSPYVAGTPIQAEGEHTLVARATDCAGHLGAASVRFFIDRTGPRLLTTNPAEGALSGQAVPTFSGTADVDLASAKLNGVPAAVTGPAFTQTPFPWKEGANAVRIELADAAGNVTAFDRTFRVKTLAPSIEILESGVPLASGALFYRTVTPAFRSNDPAAQIAVQLDGVAFTPGTVVSTPGERTLQATATDEAGHSASASVTFRIDLSAPPTVDITSPLEGAILPNPTTPVTGTAGASVTQVSVNGVPATGTTSWNAPAVPLDLDVPNDLRAVARDATGRTATAVRTVLSRSGGPKVVLIEPVNATRTNRRKIDVAGAVVGGAPFTANGTVTVTPQGGSALTVPLDPTGAFRAKDVPLQEGTTRIEVSATDAQGRTGTASVDVVTDFTAPAIALTVDGQAVSDGATYARAVTVHVEVTDAGGALPPSVRLNGELLPVAGLSIDIPLQAAGGYVVAVIARDQAGNETRSERSLLVDLGGCGLADLTPESGTVIASNRVTLRGRAGSAASVTIRVPNPGSVPVTYADYPATVADGTFASADVPLPADGDNALQMVCTDRSGTAHTETLVLHRVSGAGPTITITSPANGAFVSTPGVTITGSVSDPSAKLTVNGLDVPLSNGQFTKTGFPLAEGPNVLSARAVDAASRVGEARVVVHRDTAPPQVAITSPQTNQVFGASGLSGLSVEVSGVVDVFGEPNLQSVSVRLNGGAPVVATVDADSGVFRATVDVVVGPAAATHVVTVTATDALGHANVPAAQVSFSVDPLGPSILLTTPRDLVRFTESASGVSAQGAARGANGSVVSLNGQGIDGISFASPGPDGRSTSPFAGAQPLPAEDGSFTLVARVDEPGTAGTGGAAGTPGKTASVRRVLVKDTVAPTVVQFVPAQDAGAAATLVEPDALLLVLFSEPVAKSTLPTADGLLLKKVGSTVPVAGTYTLSGNAVAFLPGAKLEPGSEYVFRAGATLTDLSAHPVSGPQEVRVKVALSPTDSAPQLDALPAIVCQTTLRVTGRSVPGALVRLRDDDLVFSAYADQAGVFAIDLPISGNGYHLLRVVNVSRDGQSTGAAATALVRVDCSAPRVVSATFDRVAGLVRVDFSEPLDASTVQVGAETSSVRVSNGETMGSPAEAATLTVDGDARGLTLQLSTATDAFWRGRAVRLEVRPPAADPRGNPIAAFSTLFYPGAGPGDLSGSFLSGEVYDDESGRPLANALARLFTSTAALPGTGAAGQEGMPVATGQTEARGRYGLAGDVPAGRYVLVLEKPGHTRVLRRFALEPQTGAVPFDARLTPLAAAAATPYAPPAAYTTEVPSTLLKLDLSASALAGPGPLSVRLTALSGQGLPELLPLGYTPLAAAEVRLESAGLALSEATSFAPGTAFLTLPLRQAPDVSAQLLAARYDTATGQWLTLPLPQRSTGGDGVVRARVELYGPGAVAVLLVDADPAIRPPQAPTQTGQPLAGSTLPATIPALTGALSLDPPTVPPTGRSTAKVVARSGDGTSPWPSGLAVQAFLDEKLVLATGEEVFEAPFAADLVLYHYPLTAAEQGTATAAAAGAAFFRVSPSERAAQERLQSGFENIRLFAFPSEIERGQILGPQGGSIAGTDGVELTVPEGALGRRTIVKARLLTTAEIASYAAPEGFTLVTAVMVELEGQTLARQATLRLNVPQGTPPDTAGDPRLVLARFVEQPADGRSSYAGIVARGQRQAAQGSVPEKVTYATEGGASTLPLAGLVEEGIYLVLRATASLGWATGLVKHESGAGVTNSRVSSPGLGTRDLSVPGGRYASAVLAGASRVVEALHPVNDERGSETLATVGIGEVVQRDITIHPQGPTIMSRQPADGATGVPIGSVVSLTFSEALDPSSIGPSTLTVEILNAQGVSSGVSIDASVSLSADGRSIVASPSRPLPPGRSLSARLSGGVRDLGGTGFQGEVPTLWTFTTASNVTFGGQVDPTKIRLLLPVNGVAQVVGDAGALPTVAAGETPWAVTTEVQGTSSCPAQQTIPATSSGSFTITAGCPPTVEATIESRVYLKVFDPAGRLAYHLRLGPFVTADGKGFVAPAGEEVVFVSSEGNEVTVPSGAFEVATLVTVRNESLTTLGVAVDAHLSVGAYVSVDFEGRANETLRLRVPAPADAPLNSLVFIGEPVGLSWGPRLALRDIGSVVSGPNGRLFSTLIDDQPADPPGFEEEPSALLSTRPTSRTQAGPTARLPRKLIGTALIEVISRMAAVFVYSAGAELSAMTGNVMPFEIAKQFEALYTSYAEAMVYVPEPHSWRGRYILPIGLDAPFTLFRRDRATGFVGGTQAFGPLGAGAGSFVQVPIFQDLEFRPPVLTDVYPFSLVRFSSQKPTPGSVQSCLRLTLELEACTLATQHVELRTIPGFALPDFSHASLHIVSAGGTPSTAPLRIENGLFVQQTGPQPNVLAAPFGADMAAVVALGNLEPQAVREIRLTFDRALRTPSAPEIAVRVIDCGDVGAAGCASGTSFPVKLEWNTDRTTFTAKLEGELPRGHLFEVLVDRGQFLIGVPPNVVLPPIYRGPDRFRFATRKAPSQPLAESGPLALGDTAVARDMVKLGNMFLVASATGRIVAFDVSTARSSSHAGAGAPPVGTFEPFAVMTERFDEVRSFALDGHNRVHFNARTGGTWSVLTIRLEDVRQPTPCPPNAVPGTLATTSCFSPVVGGVRTARTPIASSGLLATEYIANIGTLASGSAVGLEAVVDDDVLEKKELRSFYETYKAPGSAADFDALPRDPDGFVTFSVRLDVNSRRAQRSSTCNGQRTYDHYQRVTIDNLTTAQSFSYDVENPWPGGMPANGVLDAVGIRARRGDELRIRYNKYSYGAVAILASGVTLVDLNRFYRIPLETTALPNDLDGQCGRRLERFEGEALSFPVCTPGEGSVVAPRSLAMTTAIAALGRTGGLPTRGGSNLDFYTVLRHFGGTHIEASRSRLGSMNAPSGDLACMRSLTNDPAHNPEPLPIWMSAVAVARDVTWVDRHLRGKPEGTWLDPNDPPDPDDKPDPPIAPVTRKGDLAFYSLGEAGIVAYDVGDRSLQQIVGRFYKKGHHTFRLQVDEKLSRLYAGGTTATNEPFIDVWDITRVNGLVSPNGDDPRLLLSVKAPWDVQHLGIDDAGMGLVYTWGETAQILPLGDPTFVFAGLYRPESDEPPPPPGQQAPSGPYPTMRPTSLFAPLGVPLRRDRRDEDDATKLKEDEKRTTAAFRLRVALPGDVGESLIAKVQSLRELPAGERLAKDSVGGAIAPPGGPGWPSNEVFVTLRRLGQTDAVETSLSTSHWVGEQGRLSTLYNLYESKEVVLLLADPRARRSYTLQDLPEVPGVGGAPPTDQLADEKTQCRRCARPTYVQRLIDDGLIAAGDVKELLAGGPYVRAILSTAKTDPGDPAVVVPIDTNGWTQSAVTFFETASSALQYRAPVGVARMSAHADSVPSPIQSALVEPPLNAAVWETEERGVRVLLSSGEVEFVESDYRKPGRGVDFAFERTYRSGLLGYSALGASGWSSPLAAHLRLVPLYGDAEHTPPSFTVPYGTPPQDMKDVPVMVEYHDGYGHVFRFYTPDRRPGMRPCPVTHELDAAGSSAGGYCTAIGFYVRLQKLDSGGFRLIAPQRDVLLFDARGRLIEVRDRYRRNAQDPSAQGNTLQLRYDGFSNLVQVEDDFGRVHSFRYHDDPQTDRDRYGLLEAFTDFAGRTRRYEWSAGGVRSDRKLLGVVLPSITNTAAPGYSHPTPRLSYFYGAPTAAATAPHHGEFSDLRLTGVTLPGASRRRIGLEWSPASGRLLELRVPASMGPGEFALASVATIPPVSAPSTETAVTWSFSHQRTFGLKNGHIEVETESLPSLGLGNATPPPSALGTCCNPTPVATHYEYDAGRLSRVLQADGLVETREFETGDRLVRMNITNVTKEGPPGDPAIPGSRLTRNSYRDGVLSRVIDPLQRIINLPVPEPPTGAGPVVKEGGFETDGVKHLTTYDSHARATKVEGAGGSGAASQTLTTFGPNANGQADKGQVSLTQTGALEDRYIRDFADNIVTRQTSWGLVEGNTYDEWDRLVSVETRPAFGPVLAYAPQKLISGFDSAGHITLSRRQQTPLGLVDEETEYNDREQVVRVRRTHLSNPTGSGTVIGEWTIEYDAHGRPLLVTSAQGFVEQMFYDSAGRVSATQVLGSGRREVRYDERGRPVLTTDGHEAVHRVRNNAFSEPFLEELPDGTVLRRLFDAAGNPSRETHESQTGFVFRRTDTEVNSFGKTTKVVEHLDATAPPSLRTTRIQYDESGRLKEVVTDAGASGWNLALEQTYDASNRVLVRRTESGTETFDYSGGVTPGGAPVPPSPWHRSVSYQEAGAGGVALSTEFDRDVFGRVIEETSFETDGLIRTIRTGFDEAGNVVALRSGSGSTVTFTYDAAGRMMSRSGPAPGALARMGYDLDGRPRSQSIHSSAGSWNTTMTYDAAGRPSRTNFPDGTYQEVVQYAPDDLATVMRNRYGQTVAMTYDSANRLTLVSPSGGPANVAKYDMAYTYDAASRPTAWRKIGRPLGTISVPAPGFDLGGRPRVLRMGEAGQSLDVAVALEHSGFDDLNEIRITQGDIAGDPALGAPTFLQGFDVLSRRERSRYFRGSNVALNGSTQSWAGTGSLVKQNTQSAQRDYESERQFGGPGRPKRLDFTGGGQPWGALTYGYRGGDGHKESRASSNGGVYSSMGLRLSADGGLRLTDAEVGGSAAPLEKFSYAMGAGDEMLGETEQKQGTSNALGVGPSGRVQSRNGVSYAYDDLGNRTEDDRFLYSWTWRGELETVTVKPTWPSEIGGPTAVAPSAGHKIFFEYDALGRLVERLHRGPLPTGSTDDAARSIVERRTYLWQDANLLIERSQNESGEVLYRKIYAPGASSEAGEMRVEILGDTPRVEKFGFLRDEEGNVVGLIDENSTSTKPPIPIRVHYSPYGESHLETGPELRASKFDPARTELNGTTQDPPHPSPNETLPGAVVFDFTIDLDPTTFDTGILFEKKTPSGWDTVAPAEYVLAAEAADSTRVVLLMKGGWPKATDFRIRVGSSLRDQLGRAFVSPDAPPSTYTAEINVPPNGTTPPIHERTWPFRYDTLAAASYTLEGRVPGGLGFLFRSGLTDNVTGLVYLAGSWYDPRTLSGLGEQGAGYAFEGRMPDQAVYGAMGYRAPQQVPMGETTHGFDGGAAGSFWHGAAKAVGKAVLVVGVITAAAILASTGVGAPAAIGLYVATIGTGFLVTSTVQAAADRYVDGQSGGQILVGAVADGTGFGSIYTGVTGQDLTTGEDLGLTDEERGDMFGSGATDLAMNFLCVAEGTQVLTSEGHRSVEDVCIGDRLLTPQTLARPPDDRNGEEEAADRDPSDWRVVRLCVPSPNGESPAEIQLLRPVEWVVQAGLAIGVTLPVTTENESLGDATVLSIEPVPAMSRGAGRLVTMKASRVAGSAQIVTVRDVDGQLSDLVITGSHPVHVDGRGWVQVQHLKEGDQLVGDSGQLLPVERIEPRAGPVRVETFEVETDHTFLVASSDDGPAIWVHNASKGRFLYRLVDSSSGAVYYGMARGRANLISRYLKHQADPHKLGKWDVMEVIGKNLTHNQARNLEAALIKQRLISTGATGKTFEQQLANAGLLNKNRGRLWQRVMKKGGPQPALLAPAGMPYATLDTLSHLSSSRQLALFGF